MKFKSLSKIIKYINTKTIYLNFKYLPFKEAIKFPIFISKNTYLLNVKGKVQINSPLSLGMIRIGYGEVGIFDKKISRTIWDVTGTITFEGHSFIGHGTKISVSHEGILNLGHNLNISAESQIVCHKNISIGQNCLLSWDILIMDTDLHEIRNQSGEIINSPRPILIGDNVWIGCRSIILKGTHIANGNVIAANSTIVKSSTFENSIITGSPIRVIKENVTWVK